MKLGLYDAILQDRSLPDAIAVVAANGLTGIELNTGGFLPAIHVPTMDDILVSDAARDDFLGVFEGTGVEIAGLNANGNPLHPNPAVGQRHAEDIRRSIRLARRLGQHRVVTMSGLPGAETASTHPSWIVANSWDPEGNDVLNYQWEIAADFWREMDRMASDHDVKVALELHPQNIAFNSADVHKLLELTGATHLGVELDASHLFWQQMDPVTVVRHLGELVFHAAAKDVRINPHAAINGVLHNQFRHQAPDEPQIVAGTSWDFVALGKGHGVAYWTEFLRALHEVDPQMLVNIEHEDQELGREEGVAVAAEVLKAANRALEDSLPLMPQ